MSPLRPLLFLTAALVVSVGAAAAAEPKIIALPPYLVEEKTGSLPWLYADAAGWEVLSTCPERLTRTLIGNHHRLHALLGELLPPALQFSTSEKQALLFIDSAHQPPASQEVVAVMALTTAEQERLDDAPVPLNDGRLRRRPPPPRYTFLPNLRLWDRDSGVLFAVVRESEFQANRVALTPDYIAFILRSRLPALPPWFVSGVLSLAARARFSEDAVTLERLDWPAETGAAALRAGPAATRAPLPLGEFFSGNLATGDAAASDALPLWQAQAGLFVRWGLAGRPRREALWKFAARAAVEPVTEALFQECFGFNFTEGQKQLAAFLPAALREPLALRPAERPRLPEIPLRPATEVEVARLKGDWERLEIAYVKAQFPVLAPKYVSQARRTLLRAYEGGSRDPRLLAVLGLCEIDAGHDEAGRPFLEEAVTRSATLRPRALYELARLRFAALRPPGAAGSARLTAAQVASVLTPLLAARAQQPPLPEVYTLLAEVWNASAEAPTRAQLDTLEEGVRLFPHRAELVHPVAELALRHGFTASARWIITLGLTLAPDPAARARFELLEARLKPAR